MDPGFRQERDRWLDPDEIRSPFRRALSRWRLQPMRVDRITETVGGAELSQ